MSKVDNKKIAKNTLYMYLRMLVTMAVSLFTTRIVLQALGIDNYGIYNVVGSIIVFFSFINNGLTTATRRYITAELAQGDEDSQQNIFNLSFLAHVMISGIILLLGETVGLWAVNSLLNIPEDRMFAANVVYQLSVVSAVLSVMQSPFTAAITANERMNIYAYLSILDVLMKLAVAYIVLLVGGDKLIIYAVCIFVVGILNVLVNILYCFKVFPSCRLKRPHNKSLLKEMFGYMSWQLTGQGMIVLSNQGVTILVNMAFSVVANAAMGISNQITNIVNGFVANFQIAFNPQITKLYVSKEYDSMNLLSIRSARLSTYLVLIFLIPILFQIRNFLTIWLGDYPEYTVEFCILTLISLFIDSTSAPLWMILSSDKNIKKYQVVISGIISFNFIGAWILLKMGFPPYSVIVARIIVYITAVIARLILVKEKVPSYPIKTWFLDVIVGSIKVIAMPMIVLWIITRYSFNNSLIDLIIFSGCSVLLTVLSIYILGLKPEERKLINDKIKVVINKKS